MKPRLVRATLGLMALSSILSCVSLAGSGGGTHGADKERKPTWDTRALARLHSPPLGLPRVPVPKENPATIEKIALGRKLFFDRRLSSNSTMSCAMCHIPEQGFTNNELSTPIGVNGRSLKRNAPTILNAAYVVHVFLDGRGTSLETQAIAPLVARDQMANPSIGWVVRAYVDGAEGVQLDNGTGTGKGWNVDSDGGVILPGVRVGLTEPLPTLRLKALRRAQQDVTMPSGVE